MQTRLSLACNAVLEIGWLFALILSPIFFDVFTARSFEPDKAAILRSIALVMCVAWIIKRIEEYSGNDSTTTSTSNTVTREFNRFIRFIIDTPCALIVLLFLLSYTFSTVISIYPRISFLGSYSRLQGLYTFIAYGMIFFIIVSTLENKEQVERFLKIIVFSSVPVSLYGVLQHYHLDTLAWSGSMGGERIMGANMGNPIFVAAYLIMVLPVTVSMAIRIFIHKEQEKYSLATVWLTASFYGFIAILQVACILFTQSRGPWLGLFGALFIFFLGVLIFLSRQGQPPHKVNGRDAFHAFLFSLYGTITGVLPAYLYCFIKRKGFRWLWLGFIFQTIIIIAFIFTLNIPNTPLKAVQKIPYIGRLGELSPKAESGTARVRLLIWDGTIDLIRSNPFRMVVGYGPESMKHVWDPYSPPELTQHESKSSAPDRAHNEAFDRIVTTGVIGLLLFMFLVGSIFYFSFMWLGFISSRPQKIFFFLATILGSTAGVLVSRIIQGTFSFAGIGLAFGYFFAVSAYLVSSPFLMINQTDNNERGWKYFLMLGLLSGIVAHFIEIHFGIAIVSTRLYFFVFSAVIIVLGTKTFLQVPHVGEHVLATSPVAESKHTKRNIRQTKKKQTSRQPNIEQQTKVKAKYLPLRPVMVYTLLAGLIMTTVVFSFVIHQPSESDAFGTIWLSLIGQKQTFGALILLLVTYLLGGLLVFDSLWRSSRETGKDVDFLGGIGIYTAANLLIFIIFSFLHATYLKPDVDVSDIIVFFFIFAFVLWLLAAYFLMPSPGALPSLMWKKKALWVYTPLIFIALWVISASNITPLKADIYLKLGVAREKNHQWNEGIRLVSRAIETDPNEETFYMNLGRILFGKANSSNDLNEKNVVFEKIRSTIERASSLNPMNSDHVANLGLLYLRWAEFDPDPDSRKKKLVTANSSFRKALEMSPGKVIIINNLARVIAAQGNLNESLKILSQSIDLDSKYAGTYIVMGDIYGMSNKQKESIQAYEKAVEIDPTNADAISMLGLMYFKEGRLKESLDLTRKAVAIQPTLMKAQSLLGLIYFKLGRFQEAIDSNLNVLGMRPSDIGAHRNLVLLYDKIGRRDYAIKHLESAIYYSPPQERHQLEQILRYMKEGKTPVSKGS